MRANEEMIQTMRCGKQGFTLHVGLKEAMTLWGMCRLIGHTKQERYSLVAPPGFLTGVPTRP